MAYFSYIHNVPLWPRSLTYFPKNWVTWPRGTVEWMCLFWSSHTFYFLKYSILNCRFSIPVARQPALPWQPFCAPLVRGVFLMLASKYELDTTTQYWVIKIFNWIRYVTLWPWPLTFWSWSHVTWCHLGAQSVYQVWTWYDLPFQS